MMTMLGRRQTFCTLVITIMALAPGMASGAAFNLKQDQSSTQETPDDNTPPCQTFADASAVTSDSGGLARTRADVNAEALGTSNNCNETANAVANAKALFELVTSMGGEADGDPVTVCAVLHFDTTIEAEDSSIAKSKFHRSVVIVTSSGTVEVAQPPQALSIVDDGKKSGFRCEREFVMRIGDQMSVSSGATATSEVHGIGQAAAAALASADVLPGVCPEEVATCAVVLPSPSVSHTGLLILAFALVFAGALLARWRQGQLA